MRRRMPWKHLKLSNGPDWRVAGNESDHDARSYRYDVCCRCKQRSCHPLANIIGVSVGRASPLIGAGPTGLRSKQMKFGHFDDAKREYVITRPDTPLPWMNYLGCQSYFGIITNTAGGYSFYRDARLRRITRYRYNNAPFDIGGRYIYLR